MPAPAPRTAPPSPAPSRALLEVLHVVPGLFLEKAVHRSHELDELLEDSGVIGLEFKFDLRDYLAAAADPPVRTLGEILAKGLYHTALGERFRSSDEAVEGSDDYRAALELARRREEAVAPPEAMEVEVA